MSTHDAKGMVSNPERLSSSIELRRSLIDNQEKLTVTIYWIFDKQVPCLHIENLVDNMNQIWVDLGFNPYGFTRSVKELRRLGRPSFWEESFSQVFAFSEQLEQSVQMKITEKYPEYNIKKSSAPGYMFKNIISK